MELGEVLLAVGVAVVALVVVAINAVLGVKARELPKPVSDEEKRRLNPWYSTPEEQEEYRNPTKYRTPPE